MNERLLKIIGLLCDKGLRLDIYKDTQGRHIVVVPIGSKTGDGRLYYEDGKVVLETRYNQKDIISDTDPFDDICHIAWRWYLNYKNRGYGPSSDWLPIWKEKGMIRSRTVTSTEYFID